MDNCGINLDNWEKIADCSAWHSQVSVDLQTMAQTINVKPTY